MDGEPETNKKSLLRSSTIPQDYYYPSIAFGSPQDWIAWGARDNKNSLLGSSTDPQGYYDSSIAFESLPKVWRMLSLRLSVLASNAMGICLNLIIGNPNVILLG